MGKWLPSTSRIQELSRIISSSPEKLQRPSKQRPSQLRIPSSVESRVDLGRVKKMEVKTTSSLSLEGQSNRQPLSLVVAECEKRWFQETLREATAGDTSMQIFVGQMYYSAYGVSKDPKKLKHINTRGLKEEEFLRMLSESCVVHVFCGLQFVMSDWNSSFIGIIGSVWISRASRSRSLAWRVSDKQAGYTASDSDSDELNDNPK